MKITAIDYKLYLLPIDPPFKASDTPGLGVKLEVGES
ncbi:hypothetical protein PAECIP111891_06792 [Paenibacillus allorhizoplanae]|uniref:Uncharacterized protein n=1 Tax=Paenibacillus allorhizoplanae TaxID=2905648 RepID=A0ABN8HAY0_9BACL|nr:hypothetical protein PAECIP111891_06792 [Paenibacillus allorhizoplanae]